MDEHILEIRYAISQAAADLYEQDPERFTFENAGCVTGMSPAEISEHFENREEVIRFWYEAIVHRYRLMIRELDDFDELTLSERMSNFIYASLSMMDENRNFVNQTFDEYIYRPGQTTGMVQEVEKLADTFIIGDGRIPGFNRMFTGTLLYGFLADEYLEIIKFWISDESKNSERTLELVDKLTAFLEEMLYNAVITKGFDLVRFLYEHGAVRIPNLLRLTRRILPF
jgi:hypothetical protein